MSVTGPEPTVVASRPRNLVVGAVAWAAIIYFGALLSYGTFAWIQRVGELSRGGNGTSAVSLAVAGSLTSILPVGVIACVRLSNSRMTTRAAALYGLGLSMPLLIVLVAAYNI